MTTADAATAATRSSRSPVAGLRVLGRPTLYLLGLASALKALALVGMASALAGGIVGVIDGTDSWRQALLWGFASAALRAGVTWAQRVIAARALLGTKERLRADLAERLVSGGGVRVGSHTTLATQGLDELDKYFTVFLPAMVNAACLPLLVGARILFADWVSALIVVLTVPLIPLFMALIGMHTQERVADATTALARLSDHLVELARGLPVLIGLGRAREQVQALRGISEGFRIRTMQTLRTAFLSSFALELIATISVAVVAVFIGVRLVDGTMPLELGLLALLLAPECFTPFREVGTAFHSAQDGREALDRVTRVLDAPLARSVVVAEAGQVRVQGLGVRYADRAEDAITGLTFEAPRNSITVIDGPSGAGKSTVLAVLAGRLRDTDATPLSDSSATPASAVTITGTVTGIDPAHVAWLPQHPHTVADTVQEELALYAADSDFAAARIHSLLATLGLAHLASADPIRLSPGELRRLAFARVLLRVDAGAELVLLDEPTAHLDAASVTAVLSLISGLRGRATVIMASHDDEVRALADHTVRLGEAAGARPAFDRLAEADAEASAISETAGPETEDSGLREGSAFRELALFFRPVAARIISTLVLGTLAATFAIALTAVSAWLIVRASEQPPIMYLLVAIVGVRFFGIGRAVLRYSERLLGHDAVFSALTTLRLRLWTGLAEKGATRRSLLSGASALDRLVRDADQVRDLSLRVVMPVLVGAATMLAAIVGLALISPETVPLLLALAAMVLIVAPAVALAADRASSRGEQELRSTVLRRFAALLGAADELRVNGVDGLVRHQLRTLDAAASRTARRGAWALGLGGAIIVAACSITALLVLPLTAQSVASGALDGALVAVLVLTPLGLIDPLLDLVGGVQQWPALRAMLRRVSVITTPETVGDDSSAASGPSRHEVPPTVTSLQLQDVTARWPGTSTPVFAPLTAEVARGEWLVVTGRSGSGKSTLLTLLLGHLSPETGRYLVNGTDTATMDASALRRRFAWCPQEGHLFDSTLRANLLIARTRSDAPDDDEMLDALWGVGLGPLLSRLPQGLDTLIGSSGSLLSGGERQRVAVARTLLTRSDVILIDEPTAHLDEEAAEALMADLRVGLADRITVLVTHLAVGLRHDDVRVHLSPAVSGPGGEGHRQPLSVNVGAPA